MHFPHVAYHATETPRVVRHMGEFESLGPEWSFNPVPPPEPATPHDPVAERLAELELRVEALESCLPRLNIGKKK